MVFLSRPESSPAVATGQLTPSEIHFVRRGLIPFAGVVAGVSVGIFTGIIGCVVAAEATTIGLEQLHEKFIVRASVKIG